MVRYLCYYLKGTISTVSKKCVLLYKYIPTVPPVLVEPLRESLNYTLGSHVTLLCEVTGIPVPSITWLKDGTLIGKRKAIICVIR